MAKNLKNTILEIKDGCTGCSVCSIVCTKKCITISENNEGFYSPSIDLEKCINCGVCKKVCYKFINEQNDNEENIYNSKGYLAYSKNDAHRKQSSSGGIGASLANYSIENNIHVIGVEYDLEKNNAKHIKISSKKDIDKITGSKYLPSYTLDAFSSINENEKYMVFGTPCQIYGMNKYKKLKKLDNLILVDFFCHGVPTLNLWKAYIKYIDKNNNIGNLEKVNFRDKSTGWHNYSINIKGKNGSYVEKAGNEIFYKMFLKNLCLSKSCYDCKLRFNKIYSDIRLGDFWGPKCENDEIGTSIVLTNTIDGERLIRNLNNIHIEQITFEEIKESQFVNDFKIPGTRDKVLYDLYNQVELDKVYNRYLRNIIIKEKIYWKLNQIKNRLWSK